MTTLNATFWTLCVLLLAGGLSCVVLSLVFGAWEPQEGGRGDEGKTNGGSGAGWGAGAGGGLTVNLKKRGCALALVPTVEFFDPTTRVEKNAE